MARGEFELTDTTLAWAASGVRDSTEHNVLANPTSNVAGDTTTSRFDNFREDQVTRNWSPQPSASRSS